MIKAIDARAISEGGSLIPIKLYLDIIKEASYGEFYLNYDGELDYDQIKRLIELGYAVEYDGDMLWYNISWH